MLQRVRMGGFAPLADVALELDDITLLVGANGAGKSTWMDVLAALAHVVGAGASARERFSRWGVDGRSAFVELDMVLSGAAVHYRLDLKTGGTVPVIARERATVDGQEALLREAGRVEIDRQALSVTPDKDHSLLGVLRPEGALGALKDWLLAMALYRLQPIGQTAVFAETSSALGIHGQNLPEWLAAHDDAGRRPLRDALGDVLPGFEDFQFRSFASFKVLELRFHGGREVDYQRLSDGQRCLLMLYAIIHLTPASGGLILLDEPDAHITLTEIQPLLALIRQRAEDGLLQVVVASHHPDVLDALAPGLVWVFHRDEAGPVAVRTLTVDRSKGLPASRYLRLHGWAP